MKHARLDYDRIQDPAKLIPQDEPVFLLRAQDKTAAAVVRFWAELNRNLEHYDRDAVQLAEEHAIKIDAWPKKKIADI